MRDRHNDVKRAVESFVSDQPSNVERRCVDHHQDTLSGRICDRAVLTGECEGRTEQARVQAEARYIDWVAKRDEAFSFRKTVLRRQDYRKRFDEACQSSSCIFGSRLTTLEARGLRKQCSDFHAAHASFKSHLPGEVDVCPMSDVNLILVYMILKVPAVDGYLLSRRSSEDEEIHFTVRRVATVGANRLKRQLIDHLFCRSVASVLNAGGAKLWHTANALGPNDPGDIGKHGRSETGPRQLSVELRQTAVKPVTVRLGP